MQWTGHGASRPLTHTHTQTGQAPTGAVCHAQAHTQPGAMVGVIEQKWPTRALFHVLLPCVDYSSCTEVTSWSKKTEEKCVCALKCCMSTHKLRNKNRRITLSESIFKIMTEWMYIIPLITYHIKYRFELKLFYVRRKSDTRATLNEFHRTTVDYTV